MASTFKNHCDRGLKQQGETCYFVSVVNTFLLSDGIYRLALHRLNDFYEEIQSIPTLVQDWMNAKELCLSKKFIQQLMINDIEILNDIVCQNETEIKKSLSDYKNYDYFVGYFKDKLNNYQKTELETKKPFFKKLLPINKMDTI